MKKKRVISKDRIKKKQKGWLFWVPRILMIIFICFLALFALDVFDGNYGFFGTIFALFMHLIPNLILLAVLLISWKSKRGIIGGIIFIVLGIAYIVLTITRGVGLLRVLSWSSTIAGPAFVIGILFILDWMKNR